MQREWKYFVWKLQNIYSAIARQSSDFVMRSDTEHQQAQLICSYAVKSTNALRYRTEIEDPVDTVPVDTYFLTFRLIPSKNTYDDMLGIDLKRRDDDLPNLSVCTFVLDRDGDIRFIQKVSVGAAETGKEKRIWEMNRRKFIEEGESLLEAESSTSSTVKFVCVFGPVGALLKDTTKAEEVLTFESSHLDPNSGSYESLSSDFTRLLETETFSDIVLKCDGQSIKAHKCILSSRSSVFAAMFQHDMQETREGLVYITDIDLTTFTHFLQYVYSGKLPVLSEDTALSFYKAGDKYAVVALKTACATYIVDNLEAGNACDALVLADSHSDEVFKASVISFIKKEENRVLKQESWRKFHREHPTLALEVYDACNVRLDVCADT